MHLIIPLKNDANSARFSPAFVCGVTLEYARFFRLLFWEDDNAVSNVRAGSYSADFDWEIFRCAIPYVFINIILF